MNSVKSTISQPDMPKHIQAFFESEIYDHPTKDISMIQTHASWVFLTGDFAYKLKKPVNFGFMDFSTLEKRKYYCDQELELNRRLSPDIYLAVCPVYEFETHYHLSGSGKVVDYCLKMIQFEQADLFDVKLAQGELKPEWMDSLANDVAFFHSVAEINANPAFDHADYLAEHIQGNLSVASAHIGKALSQQCLESLSAFAKAEWAEKQPLLKQRQSQQHIRHCHGDLHFRNITLRHGKPSVFDCIEFNDDFRIIDTMNDVAFLVMDCDAHQRPDLGLRFLSRYLELSADYDGLRLLSLYLFYRASVRGKVACILADELPPEQQKAQWNEAEKYFHLTAVYTRKRKAVLFAVGGLSGSGKSHLALLGCGEAYAIIIRSDATRKRLHADFPELELYGPEMDKRTYEAMFDAAGTVLKTGFSVILDATFLQAELRQQVFTLAEKNHVPLRMYWLDLAEETLRQRITKRTEADTDISDADEQVLNLQLAQYQRPNEAWVQHLSASDTWPGA